jgi:DNA-nicking Smr family endonuclease
MAKDITDEDKNLFREHMRSVKPLEKNKKIVHYTPPKPASKKRKENAETEQHMDYFLSDYVSETVQSDSLLSFYSQSLSLKRFKELKNGLIAWEAKLDLHGLTADIAREALYRFIHQQVAAQTRCVLIIHGKGGHQGAPPVIKNLTNRWLPQFEQVLAFHSALPRDGGRGAVYVLLKKSKS